MGRKAYIADVAAAADANIPNISSVTKGSEDGDLHICFVPPTGAPIEISVLSLEVGGYPSENMYMITTESLDLPEGVNNVLLETQDLSAGRRVQDLVSSISKNLGKHLATGSRDAPLTLDDTDDDGEVDFDDDYGSDQYPDLDDDWAKDHASGIVRAASAIKLSPQESIAINKRIRSDFRTVKAAGFKIGILSGAKAESASSLISISVKVDMLGLSEEATQAWDLDSRQHIVLLIRYLEGYRTFETIMQDPAKSADVEFRIGVSNKYKPTLVAALAAFTDSNREHGERFNEFPRAYKEEEINDANFSSLFISSSLNEFINKSFITLLKIRNSLGVTWSGAKTWFNEHQSRVDAETSGMESSYYDTKPCSAEQTLPEMIAKDHLAEHQTNQVSFPLLAAQFALRYLARCTEYCLVCHDQIEEEFEALKPYVCSNPLCLYQYMSLGFGPSVEHEILTQPYVVDLLVSFCYAAARNQSLREYPTGMSLAVPPVIDKNLTSRIFYSHQQHLKSMSANTLLPDVTQYLIDVKVDVARNEIRFEEGKCPVRVGDWLELRITDRTPEHHRVENISLYPTVELSRDAVMPKSSDSRYDVATSAPSPPIPILTPAKVVLYNQRFDDLDEAAKAGTIVLLLETLPSVEEMQTFLNQQTRTSEPSLRSWKDRVSPAALGILRWIVASNRSCIVQVDKCPGQNDDEAALAKIRLDQRMSNIPESYVQFRFAQGAPDKEQRFLTALKENREKLDAKHPTLFAWHGSPLQNWHSIIRTGLDFKETLHGRAYGHGVYHAMDQNTSIGYSGATSASHWHGSRLKISTAMSLNEIVNVPSLFASSQPYLVVQHIDWIQCRYLLVQVQGWDHNTHNYTSTITNAANTSTSDVRPEDVEQDPKFTARSTLRQPIGVPVCAISTSKSFRADNSKKPPYQKRRKHSKTSANIPSPASDSDDMEDIAFLLSDDEDDLGAGGKGKGQFVVLNSTRFTDFVPGSLDRSTLPMLDPPSYATPIATKTLQRNLKEILEVQKKVPLHELGWYIDATLIDNFYQWIVELHSFDHALPLAKDMKTAGITSVVLEIRFGKDYPHSPPFVRVIRPRFLPFMQGGGGHVTGGGAMCMELLTNSGWSAVSSIESVLLQVRMAIMNLEPKPAKLLTTNSKSQTDYGIFEAVEAYRRVCAHHGWAVPPDFGDFATNGTPSGSTGGQNGRY